MECAEAKERLLDYREGQLDLEGRMHLEAHLLICGRCLEEFQALDDLLSAVAALPVPEPSPGFARRLHARIAQEKQHQTWGWRRRPRLSLAWAGACIAFVLIVGAAVRILLPVAEVPLLEQRIQAITRVDEADRSSLARMELELTRNLWPGRDPDWTALSEGADRSLASLALRREEVTLQQVVALWAESVSGHQAMDALLEIIELSDAELEELLVRMRG